MSTATKSNNSSTATAEVGAGYLEISEKGFGFLRTAENHFHPHKPSDIFVTPDTIKKNFLREGSYVVGPTQPPHRNSPQLRGVLKVNEMAFEDYQVRAGFENLTTIDPIEKFRLETSPDLIETRVIDMVTPIGKGTRGLIVASPAPARPPFLSRSPTRLPPTIPRSMRWCC